jgi:hypothetical protein
VSDGYNKKFLSDPLAFAKRYAMHPTDDVGGYKGTKVQDLANVTTIQGRRVDMVSAKVAGDRKVAYLNLHKRPMGTVAVTGNEGGKTVDVEGAYEKKTNWFPAYFLPWDASGAMVRLTIPAKGTHDVDPDIFFTAAINGCSIFFQGTPERPTIYHCGGDTGKGNDHAAAAKFWRDLVDANKHAGKGTVNAEVNKTHYIKEPGVAGQTTQRALEYENWLKSKNTSKLTVTFVNPWGCVFGIRRGERWTFYLQENATIVYNTLTKSHLLATPKTETRLMSRVMIVREVYPNSSGGVSMMSPPPKVSWWV